MAAHLWSTSQADKSLSDVTVLALIRDPALSRRLSMLCHQMAGCRYVTCERVSDLVMTVFGVQADLAVMDAQLTDDFSDALVRQLRQASPHIEILVYSSSAAEIGEWEKRGVRATGMGGVEPMLSDFLMHRRAHTPSDQRVGHS